MIRQPPRIQEYTTQERAALVTFEIVTGREMTTAEIAERIGTSRQSAWLLMQRVSRVVPVYQNNGRWQHLRR